MRGTCLRTEVRELQGNPEIVSPDGLDHVLEGGLAGDEVGEAGFVRLLLRAVQVDRERRGARREMPSKRVRQVAVPARLGLEIGRARV